MCEGYHQPSFVLITAPHLLLRQLSGPFIEIDIGLPQNNVGVTSADPLTRDPTWLTGDQNQLHREAHCQQQSEPMSYLDGRDGKRNLPPSINVRVENTKNVLELFRNDQRLKTGIGKGLNQQSQQYNAPTVVVGTAIKQGGSDVFFSEQKDKKRKDTQKDEHATQPSAGYSQVTPAFK